MCIRDLWSGSSCSRWPWAWSPRSGAAAAGAKVNNDIGLGSSAALNQPNCDKTTGRWKVQYYAIGPCTRPFERERGQRRRHRAGRHQGLDPRRRADPAGRGRPVGAERWHQEPGDGRERPQRERGLRRRRAPARALTTCGAARSSTSSSTSTGSDEAAQRADAIAVLQKKPFGVVDLASLAPAGQNGGGQIFDAADRAGKVPANPTPLTVAQTYAAVRGDHR